MFTVFVVARWVLRVAAWLLAAVAAFIVGGTKKANAAITYGITGDGTVTINGSSSSDSISLYGSGSNCLAYLKEGSNSPTTVTIGAKSDVQAVSIVGNGGDDSIYVDPLTIGNGFFDLSNLITLWGGAGNDRLVGSAQFDTLLYGEADNDSLVGGNGFNVIYGGNGNDTLVGGNGIDWLFGEAGNDTLTGNGGADKIQGGLGADSMAGGAGDDALYHWDDTNLTTNDTAKDYLYGHSSGVSPEAGDQFTFSSADGDVTP